MRNVIRATTVMAALASFAGLAHAAVINSINPNATPPFVVYAGPTNIGWYYTPTESYNLTGISTLFEPVPNGTGDHTITVQIQTERPINGGTVLDAGTFTANSAVGGPGGATFTTPVTLTAGTTYFVDFLNTVGMGVNLGQFVVNPDGSHSASAGATTRLNAFYGGFNGDTTFSTATTGNDADVSTPSTQGTQQVSFIEPILFFSGTPITTAVPEPSSLIMAIWSAGVVGLALIRQRWLGG